MIPHASALGDACAHTLGDLALPHLAELLGRLRPSGPPQGSDEWSPDTPFERAIAALRGAPSEGVPVAAWLAGEAGLDATQAWALLTPIHLSVGSDQITALTPESLNLDATESRAIFESLAELWPAVEGWQSHWLSPTQWLIAHPSLAGMNSASLDRVLARNVDAWMPEARRLRTLQNECQMLLHGSPLNEAREARGELVLNSVWISGCGVTRGAELPADVVIDERMRAPLLAGDWAAWAEAWRALDAEAIAALLTQAKAGESVRLTLCGERFAQTYAPPELGAFQRLWQSLVPPRADAAKLLEAL